MLDVKREDVTSADYCLSLVVLMERYKLTYQGDVIKGV
jgi:hypothetical protein